MEPEVEQDTTQTADEVASPTSEATESPLVEEELLVEEISIDGMCGVY